MLLGIGSHFNSTEAEALEVEKIRNSRYGLGTKRTLEQVRKFTGINLLEEKMEKNGCGNMNWVPFDASPGYGVEETLARSVGAKEAIVVTISKDGIKPSRNLRSSSETILATSISDYQIGGGFVLVSLMLVLLTSVGRRKKRHHD